MPRNFFCLLVMLLAILLPVRADTIGFEAATACDVKKGFFELSAVVHHNEKFTIVSPSWAQLKPIAQGRHILKCRIYGALIQLEVYVHGGGNGQCGAPGYATARGLSIASKPIRLGQETTVGFNAFCPDEKKEPTLVNLRVYKIGEDFILSRCTATGWSWDGEGYSALKCRADRTQDLI